jgi:beta-galactosidase
MRWPRGLEGRLCYGGDYNPEQWDRSAWVEDVALMREAGVNLVTVGVFSWSTVEPEEGRYEFGWLDEVLDLLHRHEIRVALATPTASPPPWFSFAYPQALTVTSDGVRLSHGSRDTYCASAPAYRSAAVRIATELGRRYGDHPALALWHVHNEYGTTCYCDQAAAAFRRWLRHRYTTLDRLNQAWTGAFWSQGYADWEHIVPPRATRYLPNPTQALDFRRFMSDELLGCFTDQRDVLRPLSPDVPITTNFVLGDWVPVDHRRWAREVDLVAIDHYPDAADGLATEEQTALAADRARGWARGQPWLLMEQAPNLIYAGGRMRPKEPGRHARLTVSHVARGSIGALAFQWRASRGGAERFHSAMLPHAGPASRVFAETVELGRLLATPELVTAATAATAAPVVAAVALFENTESGWAMQGPGLPAPDLDRERIVRSVHSALWRAGITVDVVAAGDDLTPYRLIFVPALFLTTPADVTALESYVDNGGTVVVTYLSGIVDADNQVGPGAFRRLLGLTVEEFHPGERWSEVIRTHGAEVIPTHPTVTRHRYGQGTAWYISADQDFEALLPLLGLPGPTEPGVEQIRRRDGTVFVVNHRLGTVSVGKEGTPLHQFGIGRAPS